MGNSTSSTSSSTAMSSEHKAFIDSEISSHQVVIFSKTYCGFCSSTKSMFAKNNLSQDVQIHELDRRPDGAGIQQTLAQMTGQRTVPAVFVNGQHLGGNDDTQSAFRSGKLQSMLQAS